MSTVWTSWIESPWLSRTEAFGTVVRLCDRLLRSSLSNPGLSSFLQNELPEIATELSVQWAAIVQKSPQWEIVSECGRHALTDIPYRLFEEALDRNASFFTETSDGWSIAAVPLDSHVEKQDVLALAGRRLTGDMLPISMAVGRALGYCIAMSKQIERDAFRIDRLRGTLHIASSFAGAKETQPLLDLIADEATRLLSCDRASIFIWDKPNHQVIACPALGVEGRTLKLPDDAGIVGEVIQRGMTIQVDEPYEDPRFNKDVDKKSGYTTRNILSVPMRDGDGEVIGAFQVLNKNKGCFNEDDEEALSELGIQAAVALQNTREREELLRSHQQLTEQVARGVKLIGESPAIVALRETVKRLAVTDLPVLILGESGTGKEVVSQALHYHGPRAEKPFVAVNCAALTETLLESELFGHEKGAFTDAHEARPGKFELAEGGTLFLDEVGDMSLGGQAKMLRVLEQKVIMRVGGSQTIPIDVRVIAATNANLAESVREKKFREDLYYRLSVVTLDLPSLRERPEDILPLADHFLKQFSVQARRSTLKLSGDARRRIQAHGWPGNVRELRNLMERVAFLSSGEQVEADDLAFILSPDSDSGLDLSSDVGLGEATKRFQQQFIRRSIKRVNGNMSEAAKLLGLHRSNLYRKMGQLGMQEDREDE